MKRSFALFAICSLFAGIASADEVKILNVKVEKTGPSYRFDVTLSHADTGWDHYADLWEVILPDGTILGSRVLHHPHVNEQPFTRSLSGVKIPEGITKVLVRARDSKHGMSDDTYPVVLGN